MAIRILSDENITGSFEVSGKVGIGTAPTSRNLSVFRILFMEATFYGGYFV